MTENQIRDLLREMRDESIPSDSRARVRAAVIERIESESWTGMFHGRWRIAALVVATVSIVAVLLLLRPSRTVQVPRPAVAAHQPDASFERTTPLEKTPPAPVIVLERVKHPARRAVQPATHRQEAPATGGGVLIRIETPDPDVVIVLVGD